MKKIINCDISDHPSFFYTEKIAEICSPLFNNFSINMFAYVRRYEDSMIIIINDKKWLNNYLLSKYPFAINGVTKMHSWSSNIALKPMREGAMNFGYYNGLLIEKKRENFIEGLEFASPSEYTNPIEFCCNKDLLNKFFLYFKDKTTSILKVLEKYPMLFPKDRFLNYEDLQKPKNLYTDFCQSTKIKKPRFKLQSKNVCFSPRELEVLLLLIKGKNIIETAEILKISPRTAETHLYNAKNKTNIFTVSHLLEELKDNLF